MNTATLQSVLTNAEAWDNLTSLQKSYVALMDRAYARNVQKGAGEDENGVTELIENNENYSDQFSLISGIVKNAAGVGNDITDETNNPTNIEDIVNLALILDLTLTTMAQDDAGDEGIDAS